MVSKRLITALLKVEHREARQEWTRGLIQTSKDIYNHSPGILEQMRRHELSLYFLGSIDLRHLKEGELFEYQGGHNTALSRMVCPGNQLPHFRFSLRSAVSRGGGPVVKYLKTFL